MYRVSCGRIEFDGISVGSPVSLLNMSNGCNLSLDSLLY